MNTRSQVTKLTVSVAIILTGYALMQTVNASPQLSLDSQLNQGTLIGKVFYDQNRNGYLDSGERGIPGVRLASVTGLVLETDAYGRFHLPYQHSINKVFRQNELIKVDRTSLPQGAQFTSENPRLILNSHTMLNKINFGVVF